MLEEAAETSFKVSESGDSRGSATVYLRHLLDSDCGSHLLRFSCALWVYNCTGFPIALQQSDADEAAGAADQVWALSTLLCHHACSVTKQLCLLPLGVHCIYIDVPAGI